MSGEDHRHACYGGMLIVICCGGSIGGKVESGAGEGRACRVVGMNEGENDELLLESRADVGGRAAAVKGDREVETFVEEELTFGGSNALGGGAGAAVASLPSKDQRGGGEFGGDSRRDGWGPGFDVQDSNPEPEVERAPSTLVLVAASVAKTVDKHPREGSIRAATA